MDSEIRETEFQSNADITITKRPRDVVVQPPGPGVFILIDLFCLFKSCNVYVLLFSPETLGYGRTLSQLLRHVPTNSSVRTYLGGFNDLLVGATYGWFLLERCQSKRIFQLPSVVYDNWNGLLSGNL